MILRLMLIFCNFKVEFAVCLRWKCTVSLFSVDFFFKGGSTFGSTFPYLCITNAMLNKLLLLLTLQSNRGGPFASAQNKDRSFAP